jgi:hypothetical protein
MAWIAAAEAIVFAIYAQTALTRNKWLGLAIYAMALAMWLWAIRRESGLLGAVRALPALPRGGTPGLITLRSIECRHRLRLFLLVISAVAAIVSGVNSRGDDFEMEGVIAWVVSVGVFVAVFWERRRRPGGDEGKSLFPASLSVSRNGWSLSFSWVILALLVILALGTGFRLWHLRQNPPEVTLDHVESLLDVYDVVERGLRPLFFHRNTGREPVHFYWVAALVRLTGMPIDFYALKLGTAMVGVLMLPGVYLVARELYGRWVGLWAAAFAAIASWPVILSRIGLRFPLAPLASTWALYFLFRGLRSGRRNDFLLLGLTLGAGLYGYTAFRLIPLAVVLCWTVVGIAARRDILGGRLHWRNIALTVLCALLVFVPLGTFMLCKPDSFWCRVSWYLVDNPPTEPPGLAFLHNLKNLALMFHWRGDIVAWNSVRGEPVLDPILGGLMVLGLVIALGRVITWRKHDPLTSGLLVAGVVGLLPSALSLSFPGENPSVVRASSAIPVVLTLAALPVGVWTEGILQAWSRRWQRILVCLGTAGLLLPLVLVNGHRIFVRYAEEYRRNVLNTSEIAAAIRGFEATIGSVDGAYVVAWPDWVNVRALALELGRSPEWPLLLENAAQAADHVGESEARMYILHPGDKGDLRQLQQLFPNGITHRYRSRWERDFVLYVVPAIGGEP